MRNWDQPLTGRQLVTIIVVCATVAALIWQGARSVRETDRLWRVYDCDGHAPTGWDCQHFPTGYPGAR